MPQANIHSVYNKHKGCMPRGENEEKEEVIKLCVCVCVCGGEGARDAERSGGNNKVTIFGISR